MLVGLAVLGVLAAIVLVAINPAGQMEKARETEMRYDLSNSQRAITAYYLDKKIYPKTLEELVPEYLLMVPVGDGYRYSYELSPNQNDFFVCVDGEGSFCIGKDGRIIQRVAISK